jgi:transposase-like protein
MYVDKNLKMTTLKGECAYCRQKRIERKGERWQDGDDPTSPWYSKYVCLDCGEHFMLVEKV